MTLKELPTEVTDVTFDNLVEMALEIPQSADWSDIYYFLIDNNYTLLRKILDKIDEYQKSIEQAKEDAKSEEQK